MSNFLVRRLIQGLATLWVVTSLLFFTLRLAPGGPFDAETALSPQLRELINQKYGLHLPMHEQYFRYLKSIVSADFGISLSSLEDKPVSQIINTHLPVSISLGLIALLFAVVGGVFFGVLSVSASQLRVGQIFNVIFLALSSLPSYLLGGLLIWLFAVNLKWFPVALWEYRASWVLPSLTLGLRPLALIARLTRASLLETLKADYIRTAYAKGLKPTSIWFKHALRNSLIPVVSLLGPLITSVFAGSFVVETLFAIPGMGRSFVHGLLDRDYPLVMGVVILYGFIFIILSLLVDIVLAIIDPRIRLYNASGVD